TPPDGLFDYTAVYDSLGLLHQEVTRTQATDLDYRMTDNYSDFDPLGHFHHDDRLNEDSVAGTSSTLTIDYSYDDLGRRIIAESHLASGELSSEAHYSYDDDARTITTTVNQPKPPDGGGGKTITKLDTFDADYRWIASHQVWTFPTNTQTTDIVNT